MDVYIAFDSHKRYTHVEPQQVGTGKVKQLVEVTPEMQRLETTPGWE
jgi:hypothetical protein